MLKFIIPLLIWATGAAAQPMGHGTQLTVLSGWDDADGTRVVALRIDMADGWKTYWRAPGDAGIPPLIRMGNSDAVTGASIYWPVPKVFDQGAARSIGYESSVTVPMRLTRQATTGPLRLQGRIDIGVCDEVCIPVSLPFDAQLPPTTVRDPAIIAALVNRPDTAKEAGVTNSTCKLSPTDDGLEIEVRFALPKASQVTDVVIEAGNPHVWVSQPDMQRDGRVITATADMVHVDAGVFSVDRSKLRMTAFGKSLAVDIQGCKAP